jgi:Single-stranded DNA-specific exonuclease
LIDGGAQLIVTVDNGVSGAKEIEYANSRGVDVVITDHHELPASCLKPPQSFIPSFLAVSIKAVIFRESALLLRRPGH